MPPVRLTLELACTREEAARFVAVLVFLHDHASDPAAEPGPELDGLFGPQARDTILGIVGHPMPLGLNARYDHVAGELVIADEDGAPNLAALPLLLLWLYPDKLPIAYSVHVTERPDLAVWTIVSLSRIEITQHEGEVAARLEALRAIGDTPRRLDLLPTKPLPRSDG